MVNQNNNLSPSANHDAPDDDFSIIMELTKKEKKELLEMWRSRQNGKKP